jgi:hypothetical protein
VSNLPPHNDIALQEKVKRSNIPNFETEIAARAERRALVEYAEVTAEDSENNAKMAPARDALIHKEVVKMEERRRMDLLRHLEQLRVQAEREEMEEMMQQSHHTLPHDDDSTDKIDKGVLETPAVTPEQSKEKDSSPSTKQEIETSPKKDENSVADTDELKLKQEPNEMQPNTSDGFVK